MKCGSFAWSPRSIRGLSRKHSLGRRYVRCRWIESVAPLRKLGARTSCRQPPRRLRDDIETERDFLLSASCTIRAEPDGGRSHPDRGLRDLVSGATRRRLWEWQ